MANRSVIARSETVARRRRSKLGDSSLCSEQAPQSQNYETRLPRSPLVTRNDNIRELNTLE
jgi:hypothetical protein